MGAFGDEVKDSTSTRILMGQKLNQVQQGRPFFAGVTGGSGTAYTATLQDAPTALVDGLTITFRAHTVSTGAATLALNGLAPIALAASAGVVLSAGDITTNGLYTAVYYSGYWYVFGASLAGLLKITHQSDESGTITSSASTSEVDISNTTFNVTIPAGQTYLILYKIDLAYSLSVGATGNVNFRLKAAGVTEVEKQPTPGYDNAFGLQAELTMLSFGIYSAGTHTFKTTWAASAGTMYCRRRFADLFTIRVT